MSLRRWWAWLWRAPAPREGPPCVPEAALREIAATHERQREIGERLSLLGILGAVPDIPTPIIDERLNDATRRRLEILLEGERRARHHRT